MITKKNVMFGATAIVIILTSILFISSKSKPIEISEEVLLSENIEKLASEKLLEKIESDYAASREFLDESVSSYQTKRSILSSKIIDKNKNRAMVEVTVLEKTTNINSGFSYESENIYHIYLINENKSWKIDNIELLDS